MDTRLGAWWSLLHDVEHLHFPVKRVRILKIGVLSPFQSKMEVLQVTREGENSYFSCSAHLVEEQSKNTLKAVAF